MRIALVCLAAALAVPTFAQLKGLSVRGGWFDGIEFSGTNPSRIKLKGFSLGADIPISNQPWTGSKQTISLTGVFAGRQTSGNDADADIYRIMLVNRNRLKGVGLYLITGYGYAEARPRGGTDFTGRKDWVQQYGVGKMLSGMDTLSEMGGKYGDLMKGVAPFVELSYINGNRVHRGWQFEVGVRF